MNLVGNYNTIDMLPDELLEDFSQLPSDEFLKKKHGITEQYSRDYPEDSKKALLLIKYTELTFRSTQELSQIGKKQNAALEKLVEGTKQLHTEIIRSERKSLQDLEKLGVTLQEAQEIAKKLATIVNVADRFFSPLRNSFYFLTRHRGKVLVLPKQDQQLAIEYNPESMIFNKEPIDQLQNDKKKV